MQHMVDSTCPLVTTMATKDGENGRRVLVMEMEQMMVKATVMATATMTARAKTMMAKAAMSEMVTVMLMMATMDGHGSAIMCLLTNAKVVVTVTEKSRIRQKMTTKCEMNASAKAAGNKKVTGASTAEMTVNAKMARKEKVTLTAKKVMEMKVSHKRRTTLRATT